MFDRLPVVSPSPALLAVQIAMAACFAALAGVWVAYVHARTRNPAAVAAHAVFATYLVVLACILFLPLHGVRAAAASYSGTEPLTRAWYWGMQLRSPLVDGQIVWQRIGNVALTIPFGFGFGLLAPRFGVRRVVLACLAWAVSLELVQLAISLVLGFVYRTFDVNDIVDNVLGAWIGLSLFVVTAHLVRRRDLGAGAPATTLAGYVRGSVDRYFARTGAGQAGGSR